MDVMADDALGWKKIENEVTIIVNQYLRTVELMLDAMLSYNTNS